MTQRFRPLTEQVQALQITQGQQARTLRAVEADARRSGQQAEGAIEDVRTLSDVVRVLTAKLDDTNARIVVVAGHQREQLVVMGRMADALDRLEPTVESARTKASGAHKLAVGLEARMSQAEQRDIEFARDIGLAMAEGQEVALARDAKRRAIATWTSVPVALAIIALIGRACFGVGG